MLWRRPQFWMHKILGQKVYRSCCCCCRRFGRPGFGKRGPSPSLWRLLIQARQGLCQLLVAIKAGKGSVELRQGGCMRLPTGHCTGLVEGSRMHQVHKLCGFGLLLGVTVLLYCCNESSCQSGAPLASSAFSCRGF